MKDLRDIKIQIFSRDNWHCQYPGCDNPATCLAHRIAQSKANIRKYGKEIIHHPMNMISVCTDLRHNSYFNIGFKRNRADELAIDIRNEIAKGKLYEAKR